MADLTQAHKKIPRVSPASCPSVCSLFFGGMWLLLGFLAVLGSTCISVIIYYLLKIFKILPPKDPKGKEPDVIKEETTSNKEKEKCDNMDTDDKNEEDKKTSVKNEKKTFNEEKNNSADEKKKFKEKEKTSTWQQKKSDFENMSVEEKRVHYRCGEDYVLLKSISPWPDYVEEKHPKFVEKEFVTEDDVLNKVSLWRGDITHLEIDAIVNAANTRLLGGGGVDGCIHRAAGKYLYEECYTLNGCETGKAKITSGYKLPAKYVIHTVGPMRENKLLLKSCYESCLSIVKEKQLESVAFCCISTGIYGYPIENATDVALMTVKDWLENNKSWAGRIIFCVFSKDDLHVYENKMLKYFPCTKKTNEQMNVNNDGSRAEMDTGSKSNDKDETRRPSLSNKIETSEVLKNELSIVKGKTCETNILKEKGNKRLESGEPRETSTKKYLRTDEKSELTNKNPSEKEVGGQPNTMDMTSGQEFANKNSPEDGGESVVMDAASEEMTDA